MSQVTEQKNTIETKAKRRSRILAFQEAFSKMPNVKFGDTDECPLTHRFADNVYVRQMFIPKGTLIVGKIHKHKHPNFLIKGKVTVVTEDKGVELLEGPLSMISEAGTKRIVFAHTDVIWETIHVTDKTDIKEIEKEIIAKDFKEYEEYKKNKQIESKGV